MSWQDKLRDVEPYVAGEQPKVKMIKLNTNENPYGPSPKVKEALEKANVSELCLYPNSDAETLRHAIAEYYDLKDQQVFIGNGSDEVLALSFLTFFNGKDPVLFPDITYSFYPVYCDLYRIPSKVLPLNEDFTINKELFFQPNSGIIFPNPNAPTGLLVSTDFIEDILQKNKESVVVIDEAYIDFGGTSVVPLINKYDNLVVVQTFSKSRALAGIRLGIAMGSEEAITRLYDVKNSFNSYPIDRLAQVVGLASIEDVDYFNEHCKMIINTRENTKKELKELGFNVLDSYSNFIFASHPDYDANDIFAALREAGILVRHFSSKRIDQYLRITIGTDEEMETMINFLKSYIK